VNTSAKTRARVRVNVVEIVESASAASRRKRVHVGQGYSDFESRNCTTPWVTVQHCCLTDNHCSTMAAARVRIAQRRQPKAMFCAGQAGGDEIGKASTWAHSRTSALARALFLQIYRPMEKRFARLRVYLCPGGAGGQCTIFRTCKLRPLVCCLPVEALGIQHTIICINPTLSYMLLCAWRVFGALASWGTYPVSKKATYAAMQSLVTSKGS
jgi:hypothetical protein